MYCAPGNLIIIISALFLFSCQATRNEGKGDNSSPGQAESKIPNANYSKIAPNHCRILATVVAIDSALASGNADDPCALLGYGSGFPGTLSKGEQISVQFRFSTAPSAEILPGLPHKYPGVQIDQKIITDIEGRKEPEITGKSSAPVYTIYGYEVK
jgi:hypothetical protein